ncbi:hypothetical protein H6G06_03145 [Anabaena sphaerica FACHB-251]|uniref:Uncharacterized protein n=1 Tax=Anabaena sphaerica FACHB-251 TaxID=2692883 RepID=A0A926WDK3_9NOST|nr:hypothetical protein [Anabaena sphaerica]MBD2292503.1 hypothetical protein [Anabaena sphaerica FACHB-251]
MQPVLALVEVRLIKSKITSLTANNYKFFTVSRQITVFVHLNSRDEKFDYVLTMDY